MSEGSETFKLDGRNPASVQPVEMLAARLLARSHLNPLYFQFESSCLLIAEQDTQPSNRSSLSPSFRRITRTCCDFAHTHRTRKQSERFTVGVGDSNVGCRRSLDATSYQPQKIRQYPTENRKQDGERDGSRTISNAPHYAGKMKRESE